VLVLVLLAGAITSIASAPVASAAPSSITARHASPQSLVLQIHDLPSSVGKGFKQTGTVIPNSQVAAVESVSLATITQHGRITGYETVLVRRSLKSMLSIADSIGLYRSVAGAHWQYKKFLSVFKSPPSAHTISMAGIGDEARAYVAGSLGSASNVSVAQVYFRRGIYNARIDFISLGTLHVADIQRLARILDGRMQHA
jgi:hypothetical protein